MKSNENLIAHKERALECLSQYIDSLINSDDPRSKGKADKLSYWLEDYANFLNFESSFKPEQRIKYKRGQIVKVHLGYNIGSEEGGLHYAVVIEKNNSIKSPILNVVPLTSVKQNTDISKIRADRGQIFLEDELYKLLCEKINTTRENLIVKLKYLEENEYILNLNEKEGEYEGGRMKEYINFGEKILECTQKLSLMDKMIAEVNKMKKGSIALVNQITTVSKIRVYDPKTIHDVLGNIRLSDASLDKIDNAILNMYINAKKTSDFLAL